MRLNYANDLRYGVLTDLAVRGPIGDAGRLMEQVGSATRAAAPAVRHARWYWRQLQFAEQSVTASREVRCGIGSEVRQKALPPPFFVSLTMRCGYVTGA